MKPVRATYGVRDNSHRLLSCDDVSISLPTELEGLTDRPAGNITPGECWWPSVGCGPVGDWWGIWWTEPDEEAKRGGMVKSEVALWPLSIIGNIEDLTPVLYELSGQTTLEPITSLHVEQVAGALLAGGNQSVAICDDLAIWPSILASLWLGLWPTARADFSSRIALTPPQNSVLSRPPQVLAIPKNREHQWQAGYTKINLANALPTERTTCRATRHLAGEKDSTINEIMQVIPPQTADLGHLRRVARLAEGVDRLREIESFDDALSLLRTLAVVAPDVTTGQEYKSMALSILSRTVGNATRQQIEAMANIELPDLPESASLPKSIQDRCFQIIPMLSKEESVGLLNRLMPGKAISWWHKAITAALKEGVRNLNEVWAERMLFWLGLPQFEQLFSKILCGGKGIESQLLLTAEKQTWDAADIVTLCNQATKYNWSRLHAWCLMKTMSASEAFNAQYDFSGEIKPGLSYLADKLPPNDVVTEAVTRTNDTLIELAVPLTMHDPGLLKLLNVSEESSRMLWVCHIEGGGQCWHGDFSITTQGTELLAAVISGQSSYGLFEFLAADLAELVTDHPYREQLWTRLSASEIDVLLPLVAGRVIARIDNGQTISRPERVIVDVVVKIIRNSRPSAQMLCDLISWGVQLRESEVITWVKQFRSAEWRLVATTIGQLTRTSNWRNLSKTLYKLSKRMSEVKPAIDACYQLLPTLDRIAYTFWESGRPTSHTSINKRNELVNVVADLGSRLHPVGLDELWERAGGERRDLESGGRPKDRWQHAARIANNGSNKGGLTSLVDELIDEYPQSHELMEVRTILRSLTEES